MFDSLLPSPLHPAIVHLPIALTLLVPPFALATLWAIKKGARPFRAWGITTALLATLTLSAWASVETGEQAGERAESVVPEAPLGTHEAAAELFLVMSAATLAVAVVGLRSGRVASMARLLGTAGALTLLVAGWRVGHSGGSLVYKYGAANVYVGGAAVRSTAQSSPALERFRQRGDDDR